MNGRQKDAAFVIGIGFAAMALYSASWNHGLAGGVTTVGAERILSGDLPYRDFWTMYAPGHFYLVAAVHLVFGPNVFAETVTATLICSLAACLVFILASSLGGNKLAALICSCIFIAATYNTGYFKEPGTYPTSAIFVFSSLILAISFYRKGRLSLLFWSGLATGLAIVIKHDVGGYTALSIVAGLAAHCMLVKQNDSVGKEPAPLISTLFVYCAGAGTIAIPVYLFFLVAAGRDMLQDLIIFPLTDFPYSRPEGYPSILPIGLAGGSIKRTAFNLLNYIVFTLPFASFLFGLASAVIAFRRRMPQDFSVCVTLTLLFLFHYYAAHVQINTHIISLSVYGVLMALMAVRLMRSERLSSSRISIALALVASGVWIFSLAVPPAYKLWSHRNTEVAELTIGNVSGVKVSPEDANTLTRLFDFVNANVPKGEPIFVGLHRHDVLLIGDTMLYCVLDRPSATRYHELHPAITDTAIVQHEMIGNIEKKRVRLLVLKHIFSDQTLDEVKEQFLVRLPNIGSTELDTYVRQNYTKRQEFGPYDIWIRNEGYGVPTQ